MNALTLDLPPAAIEAIARRVVELLDGHAAPPTGRLLTTAEVARRLGRSLDYVRDHRDELGAVPLGPTGEGRRPRLGFPSDRIEAFVLGVDGRKPAPPAGTPSYRRPRPDLLPIKGGNP